MGNATKNYRYAGGEKWQIDGELAFGEEALVTGLPLATATTAGGVRADAAGAGDTAQIKMGASGKLYAPAAANQAASTADTVTALATDFNALLSALKAAGLMQADASQS